MDDDARCASFDTKGAVVLDGEEFFVQKIAASGLADFKKETKTDLGDVRTLGDHTDDAGQRALHLTEAVALVRDTEQKGFPLAGIRSVKDRVPRQRRRWAGQCDLVPGGVGASQRRRRGVDRQPRASELVRDD
eukprot:6367470-Pyramimonas_sp.AAC.1